MRPESMRIAVIPARGGSTRIPRKNIRPFFGKPIISYSIEVAKRSQLFDAVYVSTDDAEIADVALDYGAFVIHRPRNLAQDEVGTQEVMRHALTGMDADEACCIYATCPLLSSVDLILARQAMQWSQRYVYTDGWFYWGKAAWFAEGRPLGGCKYPVENWIDINTPEDWAMAEEIYAALQRRAA